MKIRVFAFITAFVTSASVFAEPQTLVSSNIRPYFQDKERGWFWYEREPEPEPEEIPQPPPKTPPPPALPAGPPPLSAEWFRKNLESYRDKALDQPTKENVSAYFWLQRVMLDKAQKFTDAAQMAVVEDPLLDENSRRPIATFGARAIDEMARDSQEKAAAKLANMAGIWFFYESTCKFCEKQAGALMGLHNAHGFKVLPIAIDGLPLPGNPFPDFIPDRGQAKKLGVEMTPAIFLVKPGAEGGVIQIAQSLIAGDEIVQRSIMLAHEKGWLDDTEYQQTIPSRSLVVDTSLGKQVTEQQLQNPADLTEAIRASLRKKIKP